MESGVRMDAQGSPEERVAVDERVLGFARYSIVPGLVILAVWVFWAHIMPAINSEIEFDNPIVAGDVIDLGGGELTFVPAVGWQLEAGVRVDDENAVPVMLGSPTSATVTEELVEFTVNVAPWDGSADELMDRVLEINEDLDEILAKDVTQRTAVRNSDGVRGEIAGFTGTDEEGAIATFVFETEPQVEGGEPLMVGVEVIVRGDPDALEEHAEEIGLMIDSISYKPVPDAEEAGS